MDNMFGFDFHGAPIGATSQGARSQDLIPSPPQTPAQPLGAEGNTLPTARTSGPQQISGVPAVTGKPDAA